jgi:hypothetical protein
MAMLDINMINLAQQLVHSSVLQLSIGQLQLFCILYYYLVVGAAVRSAPKKKE